MNIFNDWFTLFKIGIDFHRGFWAFSRFYKQNAILPVTVFGSSRFLEGHECYELARRVGQKLAQNGFAVMTGGGPGLMEAANRGAKEVNGQSYGCNIRLPYEQEPNPYLDHVITFRYFFARKTMLLKYSRAFVILPGGFGTLDELTEVLTLIQTTKLMRHPVVFLNKTYWKGFFDWIDETLVKSGAVAPEDFNFVKITDDLDEMISTLAATHMSRFRKML